MKNFWQVCQNCILKVQRNIYGEYFCLKNLKCSNILCGLLFKKFSAGLSKLHSFFPGELFTRKFFYKSFINSSFFFGLRLKFFGGIVETAFCIFRGTFWGKTFVWKGYRFKVFLRAVVEKFSEVLSKLLPQFPGEDIGRNFLFEETYKAITFFCLRVEIFGGIVKTAFYIFKGRLIENIFVWEKL